LGYENYVTAKEIADYLGVARSTIYDWVRDEFIPHYRVSERKILFRKSEIDEWMTQRHNAGRSSRLPSVSVA
jgi:excisionase family DNA binding protein